METNFTVEQYALVEEIAAKKVHGKVYTVRYEEYKSAGLEGLLKGLKRYDENSGMPLKGYLKSCIRNEITSFYRKRKDVAFDDNYEFETYRDELDEMREDQAVEVRKGNMHDTVERIVLDTVARIDRNGRNAQRDAHIVNLYIGLNGASMKIKDIASMFNLSHENVRLVVRKTINAMRRDSYASSLIYGYVA